MSETSSWFGEIPWVDFHVKIHCNKKIMASPCFAACRGAANSQSFDMFKNPGIFHGAWRIAGERVSHQFDDEYLHWWDWDGIFEYIWQYSASSHERTPKKQVIAWFAWFAITTSYDDAKSKKDSMTQGYPQFFHSSYIIDQSDGTRQIWKKFGFGQVGQVIQVSSFDLSHFLRIRSWNYTQSFDCLLSRFLEAFKKQTTFVFFWNMFPEMNLRYVCNSCFMIHSLKPSNPSRNLISGPSQLPRKHSFGPRPNGYWMRAKVVARDLCLGAEQDSFVYKKGRTWTWNNPV